MKVFGVLLAAVLLTVAVVSLTRSPSASVAAEPVTRQNRLQLTVESLQRKLTRVPTDVSGWAQLGSSYVELARITADSTYYGKAQGALDRSLKLAPEGNGEAMTGMGALANARHDFAAAKDWATRAQAVLPDTAEVYGVLADALTQLGDDRGAMDAVQRMLDLRPNVAAFSRASYHFELHGQQAEAQQAMQRGLEAAASGDEVAFCQYQLGELAFNSGRLDEATTHYEQGLAASPNDPTLLQGQAKVAAARGRVDEALNGYQQVVARAPQYIPEYARLLSSAGRTEDAQKQYDILAKQAKLLAAEGATDDLVAAMTAADRGDKAEALTHAQAEWARRQSVFVADAMAWALHINGRDVEALPYAEKAASLGWRNATFAYHRGMVLAGLGRTAEATQFVTEALAINPHFPDAPEANKWLGSR
ncbi:tetratricopeptide (TPR) repeat protein [Kibdelosporangium banguiense]|uniref:Tetratricopeptide (TPR) repeat protein n=1 Tax=Kibdelosporangium banguiense TaxID=1365924 RepID=A0ABS4TMY4_9PSEU|nr:tetratricopeptide repeat protein [Kibdelosporangium banguiense]MBP2325283.1 tetratricopeptide (TPR) repeat protein [Kibdelosporangium banguiense]